MKREWLHLVTGKLAATALEEVVHALSIQMGFSYSLEVLPITVAGLMTPEWVAKHINVPTEATQVLLPGYCAGDLSPLEAITECRLIVGPKDLREIPHFLGAGPTAIEGYGEYSIEIIAEINHAPKLRLAEIQAEAVSLRDSGADVIDIGCIPGHSWSQVGDCVRSLVDLGLRVSIDSMDIDEIALATAAGAELVLSVNKLNRHAACDWGCEVVAIPDDTSQLASLEDTAELLERGGVPFRADPIIEPIGFGLARSLQRYVDCRRLFPTTPMMMGIGNITELSDCDSAGINFLLLAICEELEIHSVLTTQVINWARTSVRECDVARRLVHFAIQKRCLPKHVDDRLVMLRDAVLFRQGEDQLQRLADEIRDQNLRIYAENEMLHLLGKNIHLSNANAFELFHQFEQICENGGARNVSASHAFYLGYELCKASIAKVLGKQYRQDESLDWGVIASPHREKSEIQ